MKKIVVLTGAGISAESGIKTFRDHGGLWEDHDIMDVASPQGWQRNPELVLDFYNRRRAQLQEVQPNAAHQDLVELEQHFEEVVIVTQNVDDLHEKAGSRHIIHLHGELNKVRSTKDETRIYEWKQDLRLGDLCELGSQLRPHVVWFGETVPMIEVAALEITGADSVLIVGTSMQVYPAAGLIQFAPPEAPVFYIDPKPNVSWELEQRLQLEVISENASDGVPQALEALLKLKNGT